MYCVELALGGADAAADALVRVYVPADFDTIENAFSGAKPPKKAYNKGFRGRFLTSKALFRCVQLWFRRSAEPWGKRFAVYDFGNN
ncbi:MAG: hypothetical protein PUI40_02785 [Oscillospiraceae bacterium]|nr:hypothetical protein [Oscillospiraceae bacterium]